VGNLAGITFSLEVGSFDSAHIAAGQVITITNSPIVAGCYPIVSVNSSTELTLSVLYEGLRANPPVPSPIGTATDLDFSICTFRPQIDIVSQMIDEAAGVAGATVTNPEVLRAPCVLGTLQMIYRALAATAEDPVPLLVRADLYERLFRNALRTAAAVELDTDADGVGDVKRPLHFLQLVRV
jgi:hypothetical protein